MRMLAGALFGVCVVSSSAWAADHQMKIGEIMLSHEGMTNRQFIELEEFGLEPFPETYGVQIYDGAGNSVGLATVTVPANTQRRTIATQEAATALGFTADEILSVQLPTNGQACFRRLTGVVQNIHCLHWGTITDSMPKTGVFGTNMGASPPDGQSLQRYMGHYGIDTPTPGAVNTGMVLDSPVVDGPPPDAAVPDGGGVDAPGNDENPGGEDDGCSVAGGASWFGMALLALLAVIGRVGRRRA